MVCSVHVVPQPALGATVSPKSRANSTPSQAVLKHSQQLSPRVCATAFGGGLQILPATGNLLKKILGPLVELQKWAESFGPEFKALGPASPTQCFPVRALRQDAFEVSSQDPQGIKPDLIAISTDMLNHGRFSPEPNQRANRILRPSCRQ